jgi:hypothetical protein
MEHAMQINKTRRAINGTIDIDTYRKVAPAKTVARAFKWFFGITGAFVKEGTREQRVIIARYIGHRWCDSTERALNSELMGRHSWFNRK